MLNTVIGVLQNPVTLLVLGAVVKYAPVVRTFIANRSIPYLNMAVALVGALLALAQGAVPPDAVPSTFAAHVADFNQGFVTSGFFSFMKKEGGGLLGALGSALGSAAQAYLLNRILLSEAFATPSDSKR